MLPSAELAEAAAEAEAAVEDEVVAKTAVMAAAAEEAGHDPSRHKHHKAGTELPATLTVPPRTPAHCIGVGGGVPSTVLTRKTVLGASFPHLLKTDDNETLPGLI